MRILADRREIAREINVRRTTTIRVDLADADEYGLRGPYVLIDNGAFRDGTPYLIHAQFRAYRDENRFTFSSWGCGLSDSFGYHDMEEMLTYANAPVIRPDSDVVISVVDSRNRVAYRPIVLHTAARVNPHCQTPISFVDTDYDTVVWLVAAGCNVTRREA